MQRTTSGGNAKAGVAYEGSTVGIGAQRAGTPFVGALRIELMATCALRSENSKIRGERRECEGAQCYAHSMTCRYVTRKHNSFTGGAVHSYAMAITIRERIRVARRGMRRSVTPIVYCTMRQGL